MESLGGEGVQNFWLEWGGKPEKGGGVDVEIGGLPLFLLLYSSIILTCMCARGE